MHSMTVRDIIAEPLHCPRRSSKKKNEADEIVYPMLERVGLTKEHASRYAHEFSGGQRQRVGIARALVLQPELVICDEPISALDVSIQAQVINLLKDYQEEKGISYLFIAHDLSMVRYVSDEVGVMYLGQLVELCGGRRDLSSSAASLYQRPAWQHSGGQSEAGTKESKRAVSRAIFPSPINPPAGLPFPYQMSLCKTGMFPCDAGNEGYGRRS